MNAPFNSPTDTDTETTTDESFETFRELKLPESLAKALDEMNFLEPTPIQAKTIPAAMKHRDVLGIAQTGTGKTGAFGIPVMNELYHNQKIIALVLAPTRELAAQIHKVFGEMTSGVEFYGTLLVGGESFRRQKDEISKGVDYIIATPGRLIDHLQQRTVKLDRVGILVLDEVDRMLDMGFLPQLRQIMKHVPEKRQTLIFSATLPDEIVKLANGYLKNPVRVTIEAANQGTDHVTQETIETLQAKKPELLLQQMDKHDGKILVFTRTKDRSERLAKILDRHGIQAGLLHGGRAQGQRKKALDGFRVGKPRVLVATDLAGRGIDIDDIAVVINYDLPGTREDYIHRIGRTARNGKTGIALTFVTPQDTDAKQIISGVKPVSRVVFRSSRRRR